MICWLIENAEHPNDSIKTERKEKEKALPYLTKLEIAGLYKDEVPLVHPTDSRNIATGAGVGVPLGIKALAATIALLYRDREVKKQIRQLQEDWVDRLKQEIQERNK